MNSPTRIATLFFALLLPACGGGFSAADEPELAGAAGDVDPGTGGSASEAGAPQGGAAGSSGQVGAGTGGSTAGSAGSGQSGSAGAGATGAGGDSSGGAGGSGPTEPTCTPEEAITTAALPESFTWGGFSAQLDLESGSYCARSSGGTCRLGTTLTFHPSGGLGVSFLLLDCTAIFEAGVCGSEEPCASSIDGTRPWTVELNVSPNGDGYRLINPDLASAPDLRDESACHTEIEPGVRYAAPIGSARDDIGAELFGMFQALDFPCP